MSGGHFDYLQYRFSEIIEEIKHIIKYNDIPDEWGFVNNFSQETIEEFENAINILEKAYIYVHRIDWLVSADDGEETFHERLKEDLKTIKKNNGRKTNENI